MNAGNKVTFKELACNEAYIEFIVVEMRGPRVLVKEANPNKAYAIEPTFVYLEDELMVIEE